MAGINMANKKQEINTLNVRMKKRRRVKQILVYGLLIVGAFFVMYPFIFMVMNSFKTGPEIMHHPNSLPDEISLRGYIGVFQSLNVFRLFLNTTFVATSVTIMSTIFSAMVAYGIIKTDIPGKKILFRIILGSLMIPEVILLVPRYMMMYTWEWINTYRVLIIPVAISAYNVFLLMQFMRQLEDSFLEAARIDGANEWQIFWKIAIPMSKPALSTVAILTFMGSWNDFLRPLLYIRDESLMTLQLALFQFKEAVPGQNLEQIWAATTMIAIPVVIIYLLLQKNFVKAFTGISLK